MKEKVVIQMKIRTFIYCLKQGFINLKRNKLFTLASVGTITACIFLMGLFYAVLANIQHIVESAEENVCVEIFFDEGITEGQRNQIETAMMKRAEYGDHEYITAEQAWENYKKQYFAEDPELAEGFANDNPLANSASFRVTLNDISMQDVFVDFVKDLEAGYSTSSSDQMMIDYSNAEKGYVMVQYLEKTESKSCFAGFFAKKYEGNESILTIFKNTKFYTLLHNKFHLILFW